MYYEHVYDGNKNIIASVDTVRKLGIYYLWCIEDIDILSTFRKSFLTARMTKSDMHVHWF